MAQRKGGSPASIKQKLKKNHGPKRHMFKDYKPMVQMFAKAGLLTKYDNYESFALSCAARGVKRGVAEMWSEFCLLPRDKQDEYLYNIKDNAVAVTKKADIQKKS